ncbi:hypothetical protein ACHAPC_006547 [Botrytis cinerea]
MQILPNLQQKKIAATASPNSSGRQTSTAPQNKTQSKMDGGLSTHSKENISTDNCGPYDIKSITTLETLSRMESGMDNLKTSQQEPRIATL